jgi:hypothetical protein
MPSAPGIFLVPRDSGLLLTARGDRPYAVVAAAAGCSASFLGDLCNGASRRVTAPLAARIEDAMGVPRGSLFTLQPSDAALLQPYARDACAAG